MNNVFNPDLMLIKAQLLGYKENREDEQIIEGFYMPKIHKNNNENINVIDYICDKNETENVKFYEINPYTICRNIGLRDINKRYIFEYDLVKVYFNTQFDCYAYIEFSEFYKGFIARTNSGGFYYMNGGKSFEVIGNVILNNKDYELFENQNNKETFIDKSKCTKTSKPKW